MAVRIGASDPWSVVDSLVDRMDVPEQRAHRLHLLGARRRRALGLEVPDEIHGDEARAALSVMAVRPLLDRAGEAYDGNLVLFKGPEVAAHYPDSATRPYGDLDLLADDAGAAQAALIAAGFVEIGLAERYRDIHHLRPLAWSGLPLPIELHDRPKWLDGLGAGPPAGELIEAAVPGSHGLLRLPAEHHAVLLAVHAWTHRPLGSLGDLLDVAAVMAEADPDVATGLARDWGCERLWRLTTRVADAVFHADARPLAMRLWARHLAEAREQTVFEGHLTRCLESASWVPPGKVPIALARATVRELCPEPGDSWRRKTARGRRALRSAGDARAVYERALQPADPLGVQPAAAISEGSER